MINEAGLSTPDRTQKPFVNILLVYWLIFASGAVRYNQSSDANLIIGFLIVLIVWLYYSDRKISDRFILYCFVFAGLLFSLSLYTGGSLTVMTVISMTMKLLLAYFIIRTVGESFIDTYIKVIVFLAAFSLFGYISDLFQLFDGLITKLPRVQKGGYDGVFYLYRYINHADRNHSIFFEPGAYQGFLNAALFMIVFAKTDLGIRRKLAYSAILFVTLITAGSTTGFVIFAVLLALLLYKSEMFSFTEKLTTVGIISALIIVFAAQFNELIVEKLDAYLNPSEERAGYSAENRSFDAQTDLKIFRKHVFGLGHEKYREEFTLMGNDPNGNSSNGVTSTFANYGLLYALLIFISYYWALIKMLDDFLVATTAYIMLLMFLWGESFYQLTPITFAIIAAAFVFDRFQVKEKLRYPGESAQQG